MGWVKKWYTAVLSTVVLSLFSLCGYATQIDASIQAPLKTDLSKAYLSQLFGTVGGTLHGASGQMLGHLFMKFNEGIMAAAAIWMVYTTITLVLRGVSEGLNQRLGSMVMAFVRLLIGWALLIPLPMNDGYDGFQSVVMEVVLEGAQLADRVWDWGLDYLQTGGFLYTPPTSTTSKNWASAEALKSDVGYQVAMAALQAQTCQDLSAMQSGHKRTFMMHTGTAKSPIFTFDGANNQPGTSPLNNGLCGKLTWQVATTNYCSASGGGDSTTDNGILCQAQQSAVAQVIEDVQPAAQKLACLAVGSSKGQCSIVAGSDGTASSPAAIAISQDLAGATEDFQNLMLQVMRYSAIKNNASYTKFFDSARKAGWITAGRYYWDMLQFNNSSAGMGNVTGQKGLNADVFSNNGGSKPDPVFTGKYNKAWTGLSYISGDASDAPANYLGNVYNDLTGFTQTQSASQGSGSSAGLSGVLAIVIKILTGGVSSLINSVVSSHSGNPYLFIHNIGMMCFSVIGQISISLATGLLVFMGAAFICSSEQPLGYASRTAISVLTPLLTGMTLMLLNAGIMLGYYAPLYPYILFTFATIGWFILVLESMVAAPLVAFGMTHPEGHDFLGKADQALMLLLGVFIRPALMIIGLIAAMILAFIALSLLNYGFGSIVSDLFGNGSVSAGSTSAHSAILTSISGGSKESNVGAVIVYLIVPGAMVTAFAMLVKAIVNQCFTLVHALSDYILRWVGGPQMPDQSSQMAQQLGQGFDQAMGQGAKLGMDTISAGSQARVQQGGQMDSENRQQTNQSKAFLDALNRANKAEGNGGGSGGDDGA